MSEFHKTLGRLLDRMRLHRHDMPHTHSWVQSLALSVDQHGVACSVMDCECGLRAKVYPSPFGLPEIRIDTPLPGGSLANSLLHFGETGGPAELQVGDPQGARLQHLINQG